MKKLFRVLLVIVGFCLLLGGCSTEKSARAISSENIAASHESSIKRALEGSQLPNVTVSGSSNTVTVGASPVNSTIDVQDTSNAQGAAAGDTQSHFRASISGWIAFAAAAVAIATLLVAWVLWSKLSASGAAADMGFASAIDTIHALCASNVEPQAAIALASIKAELEKQRGKL